MEFEDGHCEKNGSSGVITTLFRIDNTAQYEPYIFIVGKEVKVREVEFKRKVDRNLIPTCNIMGVDIAAINMEWLLNYID